MAEHKSERERDNEAQLKASMSKHLKAKPSLSEERTIRDAVKKCNARYPTKIPLEVDEDKV